ENPITPTDLTVMQVIGYTLSTTATQLAIGQQPTSAPAGVAIHPAITVMVEDGNGNTLTSDNSIVSVSIASGPNGATLGGATAVPAVNGVATFSDLTLITAGAYTLMFSDGSLTSVVSSSFSIAPLGAAKLVFTQQPGNITAGSQFSSLVKVAVEDVDGNIIT